MSAQHTPGPSPREAELIALLKEARKIIRASASRHLAKDWDQRATAAIAKAGGPYVDCGECPRISTGCKDRCAKAGGAS